MTLMSTEDYQAIFEAVPGLYLVLTPEPSFTIVAVSDAYLRATRMTREHLVGRGLFEAFPDNPGDPDATGVRNLRASLEHVVHHHETHTMAVQRYDIRRPDSEGDGFELHYWSPVNAPVMGPDGQLLYIVHRVEDVTEFVLGRDERELATKEMLGRAEKMEAEIYQRAQEIQAVNRKLDESEQHVRDFAAIVESSEDAIAGMNLDGTIMSWNKGAERIFGYTAAEVIGQPSRNLIPPDRQEDAVYILNQIKSGQRLRHFETVRLAKDGRRINVSLAISPIMDSAGRIIGASKIARDITEQRRAAQELARAKEAAETASRAKDRLLAVLSHELRTPLSPVVLAIGAMDGDPDLPERLREDVRMIHRNLDLETKLIDDLLDVSRAMSGKLRLHVQATHVHDLLRHVFEICAADLAAKRITIRWELGATNDRVRADPARLQQVFWNLVKNAVKFSPERRTITIRTADMTPGRIRVEVEDQGSGIGGDVLPRIFDAFVQGDVRIGGLGLGLAISKAVVDMHGGSIHAASAGKGHGATFTVELQAIAQPSTVPAAAPGAPAHATNGRPRYRMLLVEDHIDSAKTLARLLGRLGYDVRIANGVHAALKLAEHEHFDIVVSDIGLPDGTGYDLMREVRRHQDVKGIAVSGYGMEEDIQRSHDAGFMDHVVKPISVDQLQGVLGRVLGSA